MTGSNGNRSVDVEHGRKDRVVTGAFLCAWFGGYLGYLMSKTWLIEPLVIETNAEGKIVPWEVIARYAAFGTIAGILATGMFFIFAASLGEWFQSRREGRLRQQQFAENLGNSKKSQ